MAGLTSFSSETEQYCRDIERYLCQKNDGHLVRIAGPAFGQVCAWAERGIPLAVACRGIDRYFERYYARGPRRRPVRIEFCEADVLEAFDEWRRAVGVASPESRAGIESSTSARRNPSVAAHLERVIARLTGLRGQGGPIDAVLDDTVRDVDAMRAVATSARGQIRADLQAKLRTLDEALGDAALAACDAVTLTRLSEDAVASLEPYRDRMSPDAYRRALDAAVRQAVRDANRLPTLVFE